MMMRLPAGRAPGEPVTDAITTFSDVRDQKALRDAADVIVIGTGAAGSVVAGLLAERGVDVVMVEEGPHVRAEEFRTDMDSSLKRMWRDSGFQTAMGRAVTPVLQGRCVGGTTVINGAIMHRMPEPIHAIWQREHGLGDAFSYADLERAFDQLDIDLSVAEAPESVLGGNSTLLRAGLAARGLSGNAIARNVVGCRGSAHCNQGCPTDRKQSMLVTFVPRALAAGARLYANCAARDFTWHAGRVGGVRARFRNEDGRPGPRLELQARHAVVVAASAVQTPLLLARAGIGRRSGLVGHRLQAHPGTAVVGAFHEPVQMRKGATQGYESTHFWHERMKFETVSMPIELIAARLPGLGPALVEQLANYDHLAVWGVQVRARAQGSVAQGLLGGTSIRYQLLPEDVHVLKRGVRVLSELMFEAGAHTVYPGVFGLPDQIQSPDALAALDALDDDPARYHCIIAHLFGTALLGTAASNSVVTTGLEAHDAPGLFVADSSVFPTNLGVNPQHTISAVAFLLAEQLSETVHRRRSILRERPTSKAPVLQLS